MLYKNDKQKAQDMEERFKFVKMEDYRNNNIHLFHDIDTLEYQFHSSIENMPNRKPRPEETNSNFRIEFPYKSNEREGNPDTINSNVHNEDSKLILVDMFQRLREHPKVTRDFSEIQ